MMKFSYVTAVVLSCFLLTGCIFNKKDDVLAPKRESRGFFSPTEVADVNVVAPEAFKGKQQVIIGGFQVHFLTAKVDAQARGGPAFNPNTASAVTELKGINTQTMQALTDAAYQHFVSSLQRAGYTVADRNYLAQDFAAVPAEASPVQLKNDILPLVAQTIVAPTSIGQVYRDTNYSSSAQAFAARTGVPVIFVDYTLDYATVQGSGTMFTLDQRLQVGQCIAATEKSGLSIYTGSTYNIKEGTKGSGALMLGQRVYSNDIFADVADNTTDGQAVGSVASMTLGVLAGGGNMSRSYHFFAKPNQYGTVANKVLTDTNTKLVSEMQKLR